MVITDLDGTLLNRAQKVSQTDYNTLLKLGEQGVVRVIATGRSPHSFSKVIPEDFPIDYLVFSSGSGIMNWKSGEIFNSLTLDSFTVNELVELFRKENISFKILAPAPNNHKYVFYSNGNNHPDFDQRMEFYRGHEKRIEFDPPNYGDASQILIILHEDVTEFERLSAMCRNVKVIRATSPIDHKSIWMEIFHPAVSKGNACDYLCKKLAIEPTYTVAVGNDYNDIDLLKFANQSFVVKNAPDELKDRYRVVTSNQESGFTQAIRTADILG
jgi:Cof subfamily protein (haloacid dehalogenase superfamily)